MKKLALFAALTLALSARAEPLFNLYELGVNPDEAARYRQIGEQNVSLSIANEAGTQAMYSLQADAFHYMAEIYADGEAYQEHISSPQYKAFLAASPEILTDHKRLIALNPVFLGDKRVVQTPNTQVNLVTVAVQAEHARAFERIVRDEMAQSLNVESGVLAMYAGTAKENPELWYFLEIYADNDAYQKHRQTPHFQNYLKSTEHMTSSKNFIPVRPHLLGNQGGLGFQKKSDQE